MGLDEFLSATEQLTSHGENSNQQADIPVSEEHHLSPVSMALPLSLPGLSGSPHPCPQNQGIENHHRNHTGDVQSHGGQPLWSTLTGRRAERKTNTDVVCGPRVCKNKQLSGSPEVTILLMYVMTVMNV